MKERSSTAEGNNQNQTKPVSNKEIRSIIESEKSRYEEKGFGFIVALLTAIGFFYYAPKICREWFWPMCLQMIERNQW